MFLALGDFKFLTINLVSVKFMDLLLIMSLNLDTLYHAERTFKTQRGLKSGKFFFLNNVISGYLKGNCSLIRSRFCQGKYFNISYPMYMTEFQVRLQTSQAYKGVTHCATLIFTKEGVS